MTTDTKSARPNCALRYHPDGFRIDRKAVIGRQSAGAGFVKGFIEHGGTDRLVALTDSQEHFEDFPRAWPAPWTVPGARSPCRSIGG